MAEVIRYGRVSKINYEEGTFEVTYEDRDDTVTDVINCFSNGLYKMPKIGQGICVLHNSNGPEEGTTIGTFWCKENKPPEGFEGLFRRDYNNVYGKAYLRYDENTGDMLLTVDGNLKIKVGKSVVTMRQDGTIIIEGTALRANIPAGDVVVQGKSLVNHTHMGVHGMTSKPL